MRPIHLVMCVLLLTPWQVSALVLYETDFEAGGSFPPGWVVESHGSGDDWYMAGSASNYFAEVRGSPSGAQDEWLLSPEVDCTSYGSITLEYLHYFRDWPYAPPDSGFVHVSTDGGGTWPETNLVVLYADTTYGGTAVFDVSSVAAYQPHVRFRWRYVGDFGYYWWVDNVKVESCLDDDVGVVRLEGPTTGSQVSAGADIRIWARIRNYGGSSQSNIPVSCAIAPGGYTGTATIPALSSGADTLVSFSPLWTVPGTPGLTYSVSAWTALPADQDASNDSVHAGSVQAISFTPTEQLLLLCNDPADSTTLAQAVSDCGLSYDVWNPSWGSLYGLEPFQTVLYCEASGYPDSAFQYSLMRFLDAGSPGAVKGLYGCGDQLGLYTQAGSIQDQLYGGYLRASYEGTVPVTGTRPLYGQPNHYIGNHPLIDTTSVSVSYPEQVTPSAQWPGAEETYSYQPTGAQVCGLAYSGVSFRTAYLAFRWSRLVNPAQRTELIGRICSFLGVPLTPEPVGDLGISVSGSDVLLSWNETAWADDYDVHRHTEAYFAPDPGTALAVGLQTPSYDDAGAAGDPGENYYYRVIAANPSGGCDPSPVAAEFDWECAHP